MGVRVVRVVGSMVVVMMMLVNMVMMMVMMVMLVIIETVMMCLIVVSRCGQVNVVVLAGEWGILVSHECVVMCVRLS